MRNSLAAALGPPLVRLWARTLRSRWHGTLELRDGFPLPGTHGIFVFWHQRMLAMAGLYRNSGFRVLISEHGDGEMIARIIARLGMHPIRGSSTRGGTRAVLALLRNGAAALNIAITPDGPRGPKHHFHEGPIYLASRTGLPLYPVALSFEHYSALPTWDRFILPRPFTRTLLRLGEPMHFPQTLDREAMEKARRDFEARLRELTESTDRLFLDLFEKGKSLEEFRKG